MADLRRRAARLGGDMSSALPPIVLQAGGKGERMRSGGETLPKVLVRVRGVALLERLLRQIAGEGGREFYIITGEHAALVESHMTGIDDLPDGTSVTFVRESSVRGNVGTLCELADLGSPILFAFGDLYTNLRFRALYDLHRERGCAITVASHLESHRLHLGHLIVENDRVIDYREKPEYQFLISSGIMAIEPRVLELLPKQGALGMNQLVMLAVNAGLRVTHWQHGAAWIDVNTPQLLTLANQTPWGEDASAGA